MAPEIRYARNGDVSIAYQVVGDGPLDLVFVPGFVSHLGVTWEDAWLRQPLERLASFSRLILFDKREQGLSDRLGRPPTLEETMEDLHAVLDAAGSQSATVFGTSEGGPMALLLAASYPERVSRLILYGTYARFTEAPDYPHGFPPAALDLWREQLRDEWDRTPGMRLLAPSLVGDKDAEQAWTRFIRMGTSPSGAAGLLALYRDIDTREILPVIDMPTLVLHRRDDIAVPPPLGRYIADRIPAARYVETPGRDHAFFVGGADAEIDEIEEFVTGGRQARPPKRVLSTVLFTDIVDSTQRAAALGDQRWRQLLDRHDQLVRKQVERHDGHEIKSTGDGVLATFSGPARGISCARTIADEIGALGIEVRAGLHTGECELRDGDIGGMAVHIGARVAAQAKPGEVLVSRTVKDLVVGSGIEFEDRGDATLKGVPGDWRLYAVAG